MATNATSAGIYVRLSKDHEAQTSTDRQEAECRAWAEREGLDVIRVFTDLGLSGFRKDVRRPAFEEALGALRSGDVGTLIVWKLDRLSRRGIGQVGLLLDDLEETGGRICSVMDGVDTSLTQGRVLVALLSEMARAESANTGTRVRSALAARRAAGRWPGGLPPYGFRLAVHALPPRAVTPDAFHVDPGAVDGTLVGHPGQAPVVRRIVNEVLAGQSTYAVARDLNAEGVPSARGGRWHSANVWTMVRSPVLCGWLPARKGAVEPARDPVTGEPVQVGEALITPAEHRRILAALEERGRQDNRGRRRGKPAGRSLLAGLIRCGECGAPMAGRTTQNAYACTGKNTGAVCPGNTVAMAASDDVVAEAALRRLAALEPGDPMLDAVAARWVAQHAPETTRERADLEAEAADLSARLDDLAEARFLRPEFDGADGTARYERLAGTITDRLAHVRKALVDLTPVEPSIGPLLDSTQSREAWEVASLQDRRGVLALALDRVDVVKSPRLGMRFNPDRLRITWAGEA